MPDGPGATSARPASPVVRGLACALLLVTTSTAGLAEDKGASDRPSALGAATIVGPAPRLEVPSVVIGAPASETSLGLSIGQSSRMPANTYIRIRGLSPLMALTSGHVIAPGAWAVPVAALPDLRVVIPAGASGKSEVSVAIVAIDGGVLAEARTTVVVAAAALGASAPPTPQSAQPAPPAASRPSAPAGPAIASRPPERPPAAAPPPAPSRATPAPPPLSAADRERAEGFLARGRKLLAAGDIASARLFFRRAAEAGLAAGALAMGDTFDPLELSRLNAIGIQPDATEAREWYEKARSLGAGPAADRRLERLGGR